MEEVVAEQEEVKEVEDEVVEDEEDEEEVKVEGKKAGSEWVYSPPVRQLELLPPSAQQQWLEVLRTKTRADWQLTPRLLAKRAQPRRHNLPQL